MKEGDIVKAYIQQADKKVKARPCLLLKKLPYFDDWLICGVSTQIHTIHEILDVVIDEAHVDFHETGLKYSLVIRAGWIAQFPEKMIEGTVGQISEETLDLVKRNIAQFISS